MKKINSKKKGNRGELEVVHILNKFFNTNEFQRVPQSGAFATNLRKLAQINEELINDVVGDIITPKWFPYSIEVKNSNNFSLSNIFKNKPLNKQWEEQLLAEKKISEKNVVLIFKKNYSPWYIMVNEYINTIYYIKYKNYYIYELINFLERKFKNEN